jgi:hypothetical protein
MSCSPSPSRSLRLLAIPSASVLPQLRKTSSPRITDNQGNIIQTKVGPSKLSKIVPQRTRFWLVTSNKPVENGWVCREGQTNCVWEHYTQPNPFQKTAGYFEKKRRVLCAKSGSISQMGNRLSPIHPNSDFFNQVIQFMKAKLHIALGCQRTKHLSSNLRLGLYLRVLLLQP